ncbi:LA_0364 family Cys-rich lipoprotein [Leptospira kmetyi]|uniref:Uncharacterized protein n=1 Tax=Leptospira kmetyi TaxID=408139 RepID=A0A5F1XQ34_9LEPT|nr:hypothetical protein EFP84_12425 [Leptospira kmetyi]TGK15941.1 hypothetical protein EHO62_09225 [Leptospira kmetyi]TGK31971.1 hypothetical protein EHO66_06205 [Leptospira kmetyi]
MNKILLILLSILLGSLLHSCNDLSPREKCLDDNGCKHRAENCLTGLAIVKGMTNIGFTGNELELAAINCNLLQSQCTLSCLEKHKY